MNGNKQTTMLWTLISLFLGCIASLALLYHGEFGQNSQLFDELVFISILIIPIALIAIYLLALQENLNKKTRLLLLVLCFAAATGIILGFKILIPIPRAHDLIISLPQDVEGVSMKINSLQTMSRTPSRIDFSNAKIEGGYQNLSTAGVTLQAGSRLKLNFDSNGNLELRAKIYPCPSGIIIRWDQKTLSADPCQMIENGRLRLSGLEAAPTSLRWGLLEKAFQLIDLLVLGAALFFAVIVIYSLAHLKKYNAFLLAKNRIQGIRWFMSTFIYSALASTSMIILGFSREFLDFRAFLPVTIILCLDILLFQFKERIRIGERISILLGLMLATGIIFNTAGENFFLEIAGDIPRTNKLTTNSYNSLTNTVEVEVLDMYSIILAYDEVIFQREIILPEAAVTDLKLRLDYLESRGRTNKITTISEDPRVDQETWTCILSYDHSTWTGTESKDLFLLALANYAPSDAVTVREFGGDYAFFPYRLILPGGECLQ